MLCRGGKSPYDPGQTFRGLGEEETARQHAKTQTTQEGDFKGGRYKTQTRKHIFKKREYFNSFSRGKCSKFKIYNIVKWKKKDM